jgi:hybrid cluster-associated redox disulfide protein
MEDAPRARQLVADVLAEWPATAAVFAGYRMACVGCAMAPYETVAEAAAKYRVPLARLANRLAAAAAAGPAGAEGPEEGPRHG